MSFSQSDSEILDYVVDVWLRKLELACFCVYHLVDM